MADFARIPIIKLYDTLIVSIQVELSDHLVVQLKDDIAAEIERVAPVGLIIDVSGVAVMDSFISRAIRDIGMISKYMGARTVICGLDANIAMTLVEMDMGFEGVAVVSNLEAAFESFHRRAFADEGETAVRSAEAGSGGAGREDE